MPVGIGGLITEGLGGDLNQQMANALAGQGAPPQGPPPGAPAPGQTPAQTYAPDPQNANTIALLMRVHQQDMISNDLNRNIAGIAAGFGTAQQQHDKLAAIGNMQGDDRLAALQNVEKITAEQTQQNNAARFKAGAAGMASLFPNMTPAQVQLMSNNPDLFSAMVNRSITSKIEAGQPTEAQKNADAAGKAYAQSKGYDLNNLTPQQQQDIDGYKSNLISGAMGGTDLNQRQYLAEKSAGLTTDDFATWTAKHQAQAKLGIENAGDLSEAIKAAPALTAQIDRGSNLIDGLKANKNLGQALTFLSTPGHDMIGADALHKAGQMDDNTYKAVQDIGTLSGQVYGSGFASAGSKRTQQEVAAIVSGLSQTKSYGYSPDDYIKNALNPLQEQFNTTKANALGAAQQLDQVPTNLRGYVNSTYLPGGSLYNGKGGDWAKDMELSPQETASAQDLIAKGTPREQVRQHILQSGKRPPAWL
jgi:hypothetical protein